MRAPARPWPRARSAARRRAASALFATYALFVLPVALPLFVVRTDSTPTTSDGVKSVKSCLPVSRKLRKPPETGGRFAARREIGHPVGSMGGRWRRLFGLAAACVCRRREPRARRLGRRKPLPEARTRRSGPALLALTGDADRTSTGGPARRARLTSDYARSATTFATAAAVAASATFGQPTMAGIGGWGFEPDLRHRPVEREPPLHQLARLRQLRRELHLALARRRADVQVGPRGDAR